MNFNVCVNNHLSLSPNYITKHKSLICNDPFVLDSTDNKNKSDNNIAKNEKSMISEFANPNNEIASELPPTSARIRLSNIDIDIDVSLKNTNNTITLVEPRIVEFPDHRLFDEDSLRIFLTRPIEKDLWVKFKIERHYCEKKVVKFYLSLNDSGRSLLCAIKRPKKSYVMYMTTDPLVLKERNYLGKLKSNFFGTEFNTFDSGRKPKKDKNKEIHRLNIAAITYVG
jgi:hypothetical protein